MKKTAVLLILSWIQYIYSPVSAQVFQGTPPAEWIEVSGEASIKLPQEEKLSTRNCSVWLNKRQLKISLAHLLSMEIL